MKSFRLLLLLCLLESLSLLLLPSIHAEERTPTSSATIPNLRGAVPRLREIDRPATTVQEWLSQTPPPPQSPIQVTGVRLNPTDAGLEIILQTSSPTQLQAVRRVEDKTLIIEISNAVLSLPNQQPFQADTPTETITATQLEGNRIRVQVVGKTTLPNATVIAQPNSVSQQPDEDEEEITVTGNQTPTYRAPNANTATKTDTLIRDVPASIQVIPRQLIEDQNVQRIQDAVQNVSGVTKQGNFGGTDSGSFILRGFFNEGAENLRNGFRDNDFYSSVDIGNIERIEVLKGPASVLFGRVEPGGIINVITKQPLNTPYYSASFTAGNYAFYRPSVDLSGPLNSDGSLLYRLNLAYQNSESFRDFNFTERVLVAPVLTWKISDRTSLTLETEYVNNRYRFDRGIPVVGNRPADIPISRFLGYPSLDEDDPQNDRTLRASYVLQHQFSENWKLRNALSISSLKLTGTGVSVGFGDIIDDQFQEKTFEGGEGFLRENYTLQTELTGKFRTGAIAHQLLLGVELNRNTRWLDFAEADLPAIDIFNPDYSVERPVLASIYQEVTRTNTLGIYIQDQVTLANNLKLLVGGRFDLTKQNSDFPLDATNTEQSDNAFSPRIGIVYQPLPPLSLYASYSRSFTPVVGRSRTNSPFEPQRGTQYEVGIKADLSDRVSATLAAYQITKTNVLTIDPEDPDFSIQVGEQRSRGIELDIAGQILPGWNVIASYAYTNAITSEDNTIPVGNRLSNVPQHATSLWTTYEIQRGGLKGLGLGLGLYYVSDRDADIENTATLPGYFRTDASIFYKLDRWRFAVNFRNLFNQKYYETAQGRDIIYPGAPFTVQGTLSVTF
ncbi:TonB-dependent siderophore receptor [Phormidesmis priestleyi]